MLAWAVPLQLPWTSPQGSALTATSRSAQLGAVPQGRHSTVPLLAKPSPPWKGREEFSWFDANLNCWRLAVEFVYHYKWLDTEEVPPGKARLWASDTRADIFSPAYHPQTVHSAIETQGLGVGHSAVDAESCLVFFKPTELIKTGWRIYLSLPRECVCVCLCIVWPGIFCSVSHLLLWWALGQDNCLPPT